MLCYDTRWLVLFRSERKDKIGIKFHMKVEINKIQLVMLMMIPCHHCGSYRMAYENYHTHKMLCENRIKFHITNPKKAQDLSLL